MKSLQSQFLNMKGQPVSIGGELVFQMDRIPIRSGVVCVTFLKSKSLVSCGVAVKSAKGFIKLADGRKTNLVYIWDEENLPNTVEYKVSCPDGELRLWNIYKVDADRDPTKADAWTNNAGMVIESVSENKRCYRCSDGLGEFDPTDFAFAVEWHEKE